MSQIDLLGAPDVGGPRHELDAYDTPKWATRALCHHLGERLRGPVWECCAGAGAIVDVVAQHPGVSQVWATDVAPRRDDVEQLDFLSARSVYGGWIVSNPPYVTRTGLQASDIVRHAIAHTLPVRVAMLLRLAFVEPCEDRTDLLGVIGRAGFSAPTDYIVLPRVNYIGAPSGNNQTSVWYVWDYSEEWRMGLALDEGLVTVRTYPADIRSATFDWGRL